MTNNLILLVYSEMETSEPSPICRTYGGNKKEGIFLSSSCVPNAPKLKKINPSAEIKR